MSKSTKQDRSLTNTGRWLSTGAGISVYVDFSKLSTGALDEIVEVAQRELKVDIEGTKRPPHGGVGVGITDGALSMYIDFTRIDNSVLMEIAELARRELDGRQKSSRKVANSRARMSENR